MDRLIDMVKELKSPFNDSYVLRDDVIVLIKQYERPVDDTILVDIIAKKIRWDFGSKFGHETCLYTANNIIDALWPYLKQQQLVSAEVLEALRFYADTSKYVAPYTGGLGELYFDCGQKAKTALTVIQGEKKDKGE